MNMKNIIEDIMTFIDRLLFNDCKICYIILKYIMIITILISMFYIIRFEYRYNFIKSLIYS